ncbi:hypothetical protein F511_26464 [Dorcoceras hygrometricum]|uniref:Uncharacterized protein n=1 Tax=Dorcoceras hygrometricum TaxID=472368 RepID=A0A2Z7DF00_9LAMI|nr:hypothetical protein F511_26464 [Dorcoceras hygrometricum]
MVVRRRFECCAWYQLVGSFRVCLLVVQLRVDVNDGKLYCSLRLVSCSLRLVLREGYRLDLMTPLFWVFGLALDSPREALPSYAILGGCCWLERDREVAVFGPVGFVLVTREIYACTLCVQQVPKQISRAPCCGSYCTELSCSPYWGLTPCPSGPWLFSLFVLFSGNPGFTAGRGFNPAGGAPGGG